MRQEKPFGKRNHHGDPLIALASPKVGWRVHGRTAMARMKKKPRWLRSLRPQSVGGHAWVAQILKLVVDRLSCAISNDTVVKGHEGGALYLLSKQCNAPALS